MAGKTTWSFWLSDAFKLGSLAGNFKESDENDRSALVGLSFSVNSYAISVKVRGLSCLKGSSANKTR